LASLQNSEPIDETQLDHWLTYMCQENLLVLLKDPEGNKGYRSSAAELTRILGNLKLLTMKRIGERDEDEEQFPRVYSDIAQVKFAKRTKEAPPREIEIIKLTEPLCSHFSSYRELRDLDQQIPLVVSAAIKALSEMSGGHFSKISSFQEEAILEIALQGGKRYPEGVTITTETGAGKSLAFLLAPLVYANLAGLAGVAGTKVILVYPRNALADDQCSRARQFAECVSGAVSAVLVQRYGKVMGNESALAARVRVDGDWGGQLKKTARIEFYRDPPDILVTNADTLHRRLMDSRIASAFASTKFAVFDEIHLYEGYTGTNAIYLIRRLKARLQLVGKSVVLVGSSATIAKPDDFCSKLFSLQPPLKPKLVTPVAEKTEAHGIEYHVFAKPMLGRPAHSVVIDVTECVIHNRRKDGLAAEQRKASVQDVAKTIGFADSRDLIARWYYQIMDAEKTHFRGYRRKVPTYYEYLRYIAPCLQKKDGMKKKGVLDECRKDGIPIDCPYYMSSLCWTLSRDGGEDAWVQVQKQWYRLDNIWTTYKARTFGIESVDELFLIPHEYVGSKTPAKYYNFVVASPSLEVGIDIPGVTEVILYKAIRSPTHYRQKVGRGGREFGSRNLAVSVLGNTPQENYYFRHYMTLVNPAYRPIPLEDHNLDVAKVHATSAIVDYLSAIRSMKQLPDMYNLKESIAAGEINQVSIDRIKMEVASNACVGYLTEIVGANAAKEAITQFLVFLDQLVKPVYSEMKLGQPTDLSFGEFVMRCRYDKGFEKAMNAKLAAVEKASDALQAVKSNIRKETRDVQDLLFQLPVEEQTRLETIIKDLDDVAK